MKSCLDPKETHLRCTYSFEIHNPVKLSLKRIHTITRPSPKVIVIAMQIPLIPIQKRHRDPDPKVNHVVEQRKPPACPCLFETTAVRKEYHDRDQQCSTRGSKEHVCRPQLRSFGPRTSPTSYCALGGLKLDGYVDDDAKDDGGKEDGEGFGGDLEEAKPALLLLNLFSLRTSCNEGGLEEGIVRGIGIRGPKGRGHSLGRVFVRVSRLFWFGERAVRLESAVVVAGVRVEIWCQGRVWGGKRA